MNIGALPELLVSWLKNQGAELLQPGKGQAGAFQPGQQYEGKVLENMPNGRSLVRVNQQLLDMPLPQQPKPGDTVRLTFLQSTSRPTFLLQSAPATSASPVRLSEAVQQVNALVRFAQAEAPAAARTVASAAQVAVPNPSASASQSAALPSATAAKTPVLSQQLTPGAPVQAGAKAVANTPVGADFVRDPGLIGRGQDPLLQARASRPAATTTATASEPAGSSVTQANTGVAGPGRAAVAASQLAAATQATPVLAADKPIISNPAQLFNAAAAPTRSPAAIGGAAVPGLAMAGQAVEGMRAALAANTTLTTLGVVSQTVPGVQLLSQQLRKVLSESGMFYENHLGRWVRGQVPMEAIQREPQAMLRELSGQLLKLPGLEGMPEEAARIAGRQLMMLEGGPFLWQGLAWPGQWMQWLVEERQGDGHNPEDEMPRWRTQLRLTLPRLGEVTAELGVGARGLEIRLAAPNPETLAEMNTTLPDLVERLRAAELNPTSLKTELADG